LIVFIIFYLGLDNVYRYQLWGNIFKVNMDHKLYMQLENLPHKATIRMTGVLQTEMIRRLLNMGDMQDQKTFHTVR
jgi:hypothetical protein